MATICGVVTDDILINCDEKPVGGVESVVRYINKEDWDAAVKVYDTANPLILRSVTLGTGKKAFRFEVFKKGHKPKWEAQDTEFGTYYKHSIATNIPIWNTDVKQQISGLVDGYGVFIVENVQKSGDSTFEVYGASNGLRAPDLVRDLGANEGVVTGTFTNDEDMNEPKLPLSFQVLAGGSPGTYSYAATKAAILALETAAA